MKSKMSLIVQKDWHFFDCIEKERKRFMNPNLRLVKGTNKNVINSVLKEKPNLTKLKCN